MKREMDWNDLRYFLAVARLGRLSPAARQLRVEHSTVARRIEGMERAMGTRLFDRHREADADRSRSGVIAHGGGGRVHDGGGGGRAVRPGYGGPGGEVRLGTPEGLAVCFLTSRLKPLLDDCPGLTVELLALPRLANLASREADLAITLEPPAGVPYVVARWSDFTYFLYGARIIWPRMADRHPRRSWPTIRSSPTSTTIC